MSSFVSCVVPLATCLDAEKVEGCMEWALVSTQSLCVTHSFSDRTLALKNRA